LPLPGVGRHEAGWGRCLRHRRTGVALPLSPSVSSTTARRQGRCASLRDGLRPPLTPGDGTGEGLLRGGGGGGVWHFKPGVRPPGGRSVRHRHDPRRSSPGDRRARGAHRAARRWILRAIYVRQAPAKRGQPRSAGACPGGPNRPRKSNTLTGGIPWWAVLKARREAWWPGAGSNRRPSDFQGHGGPSGVVRWSPEPWSQRTGGPQ
jgi:hypothetical protein